MCWQSLVVQFTCDSILNDRVLEVLTHPFLAAFPGEADMLGVDTVWSWKTDIERTGWDTDHPSTSAVAVSVTGGLERLAVMVTDAVYFTAQILLTCRRQRTDWATPAAWIDVGESGRGQMKRGEVGGWEVAVPANACVVYGKPGVSTEKLGRLFFPPRLLSLQSITLYGMSLERMCQQQLWK